MGGIERASMPRRNRNTLLALPPRATSRPTTNGSSWKWNASQFCAAKIRSESMYCRSEARGDAEHADAEVIAILAVVGAPLRDQLLVREPALAAVDGAVVPTIAQAAERDLVKLASGPGGLAPSEKHGFAIGEAAVGHIPDAVRDVRGLVEQVPGGGILGVLSGEGLGVLLPACLHDHLPVLGVLLGIDTRHLDVEPMRRDAQLGPAPDRRPGAAFQLCKRVGGDGTDGVGPGTEDPIGNPGPQNRLAGAVAAGFAHQNRHHRIAAAETPGRYFGSQVDQKLLLVGVRTFLILQWAAFFSPRVCQAYKPQRVRVVLRQFLRELHIGGH